MIATADKQMTLGEEPHGQRVSEHLAEYWQQAIKLQKKLLSICRALFNGNAHDAEDAVQEALIKGSQKYPEFADRIYNFPAWLMQLTKNNCYDLIGKRSKQATGVDDIELVSALGAIDRDTAADTPVDWLLSEEELAIIDEAIASLPDTLLWTYSLHFYERLDNTQIADRQGITKANVYQRISRALKILARKLSGYFRSDSETTGSVPLTKASKSTPIAGSAGSTYRTTSTGMKLPVSVLMDAVAAEKQPLGELLPQEREPLNIGEEANLSGQRPVQDSGPVTLPVPGPEREEKSAQVDSAIASYPEKLPSTYRWLDDDNLSNTQIAPDQDLSLDLVAEGISGPLNIPATWLSGDFGDAAEPTGYQQIARTSVRTPLASSAGSTHTVTHTGIKRPDGVQGEEKQPLDGVHSPIEKGAHLLLANLSVGAQLRSDNISHKLTNVQVHWLRPSRSEMHPEKEPEKIDVVAKVSSFQPVFQPGPFMSLGTKSAPPLTTPVPDRTDEPFGKQPMAMRSLACSQYATFMAPVDELMVERWKCFPASYVMPQKAASEEAIPVLSLELAHRAPPQQRKTMT